MKTDYSSHDEVYKKLKAEGKFGWDAVEVTEDMISTLENLLIAKRIPESGKLLELGCGAGNISIWLAKKGYDVYGIDISPTAIEWAKEKAKENNIRINFKVGNVLDLQDYTNDFFDIVLDGHCFHCIIGKDRSKFLLSACRVLKHSGLLLICTMCGEIISEKVKEHLDPETRCLIYNEVATRYIGMKEDILDEINKAGLHILHWEIKNRKNDEDQDELLVIITKQ
jgi:2-polyprenyl-3-methyl-5-hydroxy-6-metoxy-1,4-benzoquinol methylase